MSNPVLASLIKKVRDIATPIEIPNIIDGQVLAVAQITALHSGVEQFGLVKCDLNDGWSALASKEPYTGNTFIILSRVLEDGEVFSYTLSDKEHRPINVTWLDRLPVIDSYVQILEGVYSAHKKPETI